MHYSYMIGMMLRGLTFVCLILAIAACSSVEQVCVQTPKSDVVYVVGHGWHAEIGIPVEELSKNLSFYRRTFAGAKVVMFGYGKRTFITAPAETFSEYILGPVPGPAVIQVVGLSVTPVEAYSQDDTVTLVLPPGGMQALSAYIWKDLAKDPSGKPIFVARSNDPDGLFYAAESGYSLLHTCNTWTADALHEAGLHVSSDNVIFSGQVMSRVEDAAENQCRLLR